MRIKELRTYFTKRRKEAKEGCVVVNVWSFRTEQCRKSQVLFQALFYNLSQVLLLANPSILEMISLFH